jgi:hypothetical protein
MAKNYEIDPRLKFFRTRYRFRTRAEKDRFFDDLVINNIYSYPRIFREWFVEKLEIIRSFKILLFVLSVLTAVSAVLLFFRSNTGPAVINIAASVVMFAIALILGKRVEVLAKRLGFTEMTNSQPGFLEGMRDSRIEWLKEDHPERLKAAGYTHNMGNGV